jgi:hypothetical protein
VGSGLVGWWCEGVVDRAKAGSHCGDVAPSSPLLSVCRDVQPPPLYVPVVQVVDGHPLGQCDRVVWHPVLGNALGLAMPSWYLLACEASVRLRDFGQTPPDTITGLRRRAA